ncbi:hypothetical protein KPL26_13650, partial [Clostridium algidicarnis]|uniref:hypothetical protein n=1 Tax=Clostridium algidicarnis TaxID=37659 RepID=UPI001C0C6781
MQDSHLLYSNKESFALFIVYALAWRTWVPCGDIFCWTPLLRVLEGDEVTLLLFAIANISV